MNSLLYVGVVTYGDRADCCIDCLESYYHETVKYILVANGVSSDALSRLYTYAVEKDNVTLVVSSHNTGSAGGFSRLIAEAKKMPDLGWLLVMDDDSKATFDIRDMQVEIVAKNPPGPMILYRSDRQYLKDFKEGKPIKKYFCSDNSFMGFSFRRVYRIMLDRLGIGSSGGIIKWGTYSGLLIPKEILMANDGPRERFYLYADDTEYTYRISGEGGLGLLAEYGIVDREESWNVGSEDNVFTRILTTEYSARLYYSVRNQVFLDVQVFKKNQVFFVINLAVFNLTLMVFSLLKLKNKKIKENLSVYFMAISDGFLGKLGENESFKL